MSPCPRSVLFAAVFALFAGCDATPTRTSLGPPYAAVESARAGVLMPLDAMAGRPGGRVRVTDNQGAEHEAGSANVPITRGELTGELSETLTGGLPGELPGELPGGDTWRMSVAGFWVVDVVREASGDVSILREVELTESRRVEYNPPLPMLPAVLKMDPPVERVSRVRVYEHGSDALQSAGTCTATYRLLGSKQISLPGRTLRALIVRTDRRFDLPWVKVDMRILTAYVPGEGAVAWVIRRDIRLLGLLPITHEQRAVRLR